MHINNFHSVHNGHLDVTHLARCSINDIQQFIGYIDDKDPWSNAIWVPLVTTFIYLNIYQIWSQIKGKCKHVSCSDRDRLELAGCRLFK